MSGDRAMEGNSISSQKKTRIIWIDIMRGLLMFWVIFGHITTNVKLNRLEPAEAPQKEKNVAATFVSVQTRNEIRNTTLNFKEQLDVRGMRGDEAIQAVTYFIDDALVARASRVKILHGTGTGALKTVIRQYLNTMPPVADFYDEDIRFGGAGITIVELI